MREPLQSLVPPMLQTAEKYGRIDLHKYPAKMLGRIVQEVLEKYVRDGDLVLDPFCGTGTVMVRCKRKGITSLGIDINRLPVLISTAKIASYDFQVLRAEARGLLKRIRARKLPGRVVDFPDRDFWFKRRVQRDLCKILTAIDKVSDTTARNFFRVCFSSIIRTVSNADPHIPPPVYSKKMRSMAKQRCPNAITTFEARVWRNIRIVENLGHGEPGRGSAGALVADARYLPLPSGSVDAVITSPPYLDAQKYVRTLKLETFWLGLMSPELLGNLSKQIIGTDKVAKREITAVDEGLADSYIRRISNLDSFVWRALVVHEFLVQMRSALSEVKRLLKPGGIFTLVVGNNKVGGIRVPIHRILSNFASDLGMNLIESKRDTIKYRGFMLKRNRTAGLIDSEWILVFRNSKPH